MLNSSKFWTACAHWRMLLLKKRRMKRSSETYGQQPAFVLSLNFVTVELWLNCFFILLTPDKERQPRPLLQRSDWCLKSVKPRQKCSHFLFVHQDLYASFRSCIKSEPKPENDNRIYFTVQPGTALFVLLDLQDSSFAVRQLLQLFPGRTPCSHFYV